MYFNVQGISFCSVFPQEIQVNLRKHIDLPWLIHFVEGNEGRHLELRKLPAMLNNMNVRISYKHVSINL